MFPASSSLPKSEFKKKREKLSNKKKPKSPYKQDVKIGAFDGQEARKRSTAQFKTCIYFMMGKCNKGEKCRFSHDATPDTKRMPCTFYEEGSCKKEFCPFSHELEQFDCRYFLSGISCQKEPCLFKHDDAMKTAKPSADPTIQTRMIDFVHNNKNYLLEIATSKNWILRGKTVELQILPSEYQQEGPAWWLPLLAKLANGQALDVEEQSTHTNRVPEELKGIIEVELL